ncbi:hypothetical protein [Deinococcus sonorensis]|uniref:Uncharacterized protein n=2 Tax=Deinococcus sonorensis TaxID=309891 RepID=A0AAU7U8T2_9DEIO
MTDRSNDENEAQAQQEQYARMQEDDARRGVTSAGGAGSTGTPGNQEAGAETSDEDQPAAGFQDGS